MAVKKNHVDRRISSLIEESLKYFRGVVVQGARQTGKSTIVGLLAERFGAKLVSLDRKEDRLTAIEDPRLFLSQIGKPAAIDEVQRAGNDLILAIKEEVDSSNDPGQYVLTGSSNFLTTPTISESLSGRIDLVTLWPFSQGEIDGQTSGFVYEAFRNWDNLIVAQKPSLKRADYVERIVKGCFPEALGLPGNIRQRWFEAYLETVLRREVAEAVDLRKFDSLQELARLMITTTGSELVLSNLVSKLSIDRKTLESYEPWIEAAFLVHRVPAWSRNITAKVINRPKIYAIDTGLAAALLGKDEVALSQYNDVSIGLLVETFVVNEIAKQLSWSQEHIKLHHYRDSKGLEVDIILESADAQVVAIEVKSKTLANSKDAHPISKVRDKLDSTGENFVGGIVFHTGDKRQPLGDRIISLPISDLWTS